MNRIFYDQNTLEIKGYSTGNNTMPEMANIETEIEPVLLWNWKIEDGKIVSIKNQFTPEEWNKIIKDGKL